MRSLPRSRAELYAGGFLEAAYARCGAAAHDQLISMILETPWFETHLVSEECVVSQKYFCYMCSLPDPAHKQRTSAMGRLCSKYLDSGRPGRVKINMFTPVERTLISWLYPRSKSGVLVENVPNSDISNRVGIVIMIIGQVYFGVRFTNSAAYGLRMQ